MTTSLPVRSDGLPSPIVATYLEFDTEIVDTFVGQLWYGAACRESRLLARGMRHTCFLIPSKMAKSFVYLVRRPPGNSAGCKPSSTAPHEPDKVDVSRSNRESNTAHHVIPPFSKFQPGTLFIYVPKHVLYTLLSRRVRETKKFLMAIVSAREFSPVYWFSLAFPSFIIV